MEDHFKLYTVKEFHEAMENWWWFLLFENDKNKIETDISSSPQLPLDFMI